MSSRKRVTKVLLAVSLPLLVALAPTMALFVWVRRSAGFLEEQLAHWKVMSGVDSHASFYPKPVRSDANAAPLYLRAAKLIHRMENAENIVNPYQDKPSIARLEQTREWSQIVELVRQASSFEGCKWPVDYGSAQHAVRTPHAADRDDAQHVCMWFQYAAEAHNARAEKDKAVDFLQMAFVLSDRIGSEPLLSDQRSHQVKDLRLLRTYNMIIRDGQVPDSRILDMLKKRDYRARMSKAWKVQVSRHADFDIPEADWPYAGHALNWPYKFFPEFLLRSGRYRACAAYLAIMAANVELFEKPHYMRKLELPAESPSYVYLAIEPEEYLEVLRARSAQTAVNEAVLRLALLAHQLIEYKHKHGFYPEHLDTPADPYNGKPMRYRKTEHGFILSSNTPMIAGDGQPVEWRCVK